MKIFLQHLAVPAALCLLGVLIAPRLSAQKVIAGATPDPSALLDVQSAAGGVLLPRMTTAEREAIANPATGLLIFNTTLNCMEVNVGTPARPAWGCVGVIFNSVTAASSTPTVCSNASLPPITHTTTGATGIGAATNLPPGVSAAWAVNTITISGTPTDAGVFNYSIPLTGGSGGGTATGTITVTAVTAGAASSTPTLDVNTVLTPITHTTTGASGIGTPTGLPAGASATWASNTITISGTPTAAGTYNYSIPLTGGCGSVSATGTIIVSAAGNSNCGAYVAAGVWKAFMCHNLGADASADPFTPSWRLNGHYYQWGRAAVAAYGPSGSDSLQANSAAISGWNTGTAPNGAWTVASKTANDPCPAGFRVPTRAQWNAVLNNSWNSTRSYTGTWSISTTNYTSGLLIGSGTTGLFLPAAGFRAWYNGELLQRGYGGHYWSSEESTPTNAWDLGFTKDFHYVNDISGRNQALSVRCVAE